MTLQVDVSKWSETGINVGTLLKRADFESWSDEVQMDAVNVKYELCAFCVVRTVVD